jgi:hypothetical protein
MELPWTIVVEYYADIKGNELELCPVTRGIYVIKAKRKKIGVNPTKIYHKHICKLSQCIPYITLYARKIIKNAIKYIKSPLLRSKQCQNYSIYMFVFGN